MCVIQPYYIFIRLKFASGVLSLCCCVLTFQFSGLKLWPNMKYVCTAIKFIESGCVAITSLNYEVVNNCPARRVGHSNSSA